MRWEESHRADPRARALADRHYNRQKVGAEQFVPPGRCVVLYALTARGRAVWVTSWPFAAYVRHQWRGAWICSLFRNEGAGRASELITEAVAATRYLFADQGMPELGMVTFVDPAHVRPIKRRGKPIWGWTYLQANFEPVGSTVGGLLAFQLPPNKMPAPCEPNPNQHVSPREWP